MNNLTRPQGAQSRFTINVISNIAYIGFNTIAMLFYVPYLIHNLGITAYGMIPLSHSIIMYLSLITEGLNVPINRYLTIDLNASDNDSANRTFNTGFYISLISLSVILPISLAMTWFLSAIFQVPTGFEFQSQVFFFCVSITFMLGVLNSSFSISAIVFYRFDLRNLVRGLTMATRMGSVILLFTLLSAQLWYVGIGFVLSAVVSFVGDWKIWRKLTPQLNVKLTLVNRKRLSEMLSLSVWVIINRIGNLLFLSTNLLVVNIFLGPKMTGSYGTLMLFPDLMASLVDTVASVLSPSIMARYAVHDFDGLKRLAIRSVKYLGIALALPVGCLCGFAQPLLNLWLGSEFKSLDILLIELVGYLSITLATLPLAYVLTSYNKVRVQGVVTLLLGFINLALAVFFVQWHGFGALGITASTAAMLIIKNVFFLSGYSAHVMKLRWWTFYRPLIGCAILTLGVGMASYCLTQLWPVQNWSSLIEMSLGIFLVYVITVYILVLHSKDKQFVLAFFMKHPRTR
jgi:membrane protein EpsK